MGGWLQHDGGVNPAPDLCVDLVWGFGLVEHQPSDRVNWSFKWKWRPSPPALSEDGKIHQGAKT